MAQNRGHIRFCSSYKILDFASYVSPRIIADSLFFRFTEWIQDQGGLPREVLLFCRNVLAYLVRNTKDDN